LRRLSSSGIGLGMPIFKDLFHASTPCVPPSRPGRFPARFALH
jgi:hypothetical protein